MISYDLYDMMKRDTINNKTNMNKSFFDIEIIFFPFLFWVSLCEKCRVLEYAFYESSGKEGAVSEWESVVFFLCVMELNFFEGINILVFSDNKKEVLSGKFVVSIRKDVLLFFDRDAFFVHGNNDPLYWDYV